MSALAIQSPIVQGWGRAGWTVHWFRFDGTSLCRRHKLPAAGR